MDLNILRLTYFLILKRRASALFSLMERSLTSYCQLTFVSIFTPRNLTLSVGYSLFPYNFIFRSISNYFFLNLKITILVFFYINQLTRCFKSTLTSLLSFLIKLWKWWTLQSFIAWLTSFIYNKSRGDPRTALWGTPQFMAARPDSYPFIDTYWLRLSS